jgi:hypothetical protein
MSKYGPFEKAIMKVVKEELDKNTTQLVNNNRYLGAFLTAVVAYEIENEFGL